MTVISHTPAGRTNCTVSMPPLTSAYTSKMPGALGRPAGIGTGLPMGLPVFLSGLYSHAYAGVVKAMLENATAAVAKAFLN